MAEIIDLTVSPTPEIIEISSDQEDAPPPQETKQRKKKKGKTSNGLTTDSGIASSAQPSRARSPDVEVKLRDVNDVTIPHPKFASQTPQSSSSTTVDEPGLFFFDGAAAPIAVNDVPGPPESNEDGKKLLLPSHVEISHDDGPIPVEVIPPPPDPDDEGCIEYLDYEGPKAPGLARYFEVEEEDANHPRAPTFKCKNCGAEGDHKTYECPIQICLTCGARDEHSTRSCPISKICYTCGMKGHINKTCPNRFSAHISSDLHGDCDRCGSTEHKANECPTLWRIYQYVNDEEHMVILQSRKEQKPYAIGDGEGYIGRGMWCYNCAATGHLGDDCDEMPHLATFPLESSAFSAHNLTAGPFYDSAAEPDLIKRGPRDLESSINWPRAPDEWDAGTPAHVGMQGRNKDRERLEKRFREQEDEAEDWFSDIRNVKKRGMDQRAPPPGPRGRSIRFGSIKDGRQGPSPLPSGANGSSLLARLGGTLGGKEGGNQEKSGRGRGRHESSAENALRIRGAATEHGKPRRMALERGESRDQLGGSRRGHGPRYRGGYDR